MAHNFDGRVVIVTGAGGGIGRNYCLEFAKQGAKVVVCDLGNSVDGSGNSTGPADDVVGEIEAMGGEAMANYSDVSSWEDCEALIKATIDRFGDLHALVCNAGILRDRSLANMSEEEWDAVFNVHGKGTFCPVRHAAAYWREKSQETGGPVEARVVLTSSVAGMYGNRGQANYGPAKSAIAMFGISAAEELERYGVQVNVICPVALSRMTESIIMSPKRLAQSQADIAEGKFVPQDPANVAPLTVWLCSPANTSITGRIFSQSGSKVTEFASFHPVEGAEISNGKAKWEVEQLTEAMEELTEISGPPIGTLSQQMAKGARL